MANFLQSSHSWSAAVPGKPNLIYKQNLSLLIYDTHRKASMSSRLALWWHFNQCAANFRTQIVLWALMCNSKSGLGFDLDLSPIFIENGLELDLTWICGLGLDLNFSEMNLTWCKAMRTWTWLGLENCWTCTSLLWGMAYRLRTSVMREITGGHCCQTEN